MERAPKRTAPFWGESPCVAYYKNGSHCKERARYVGSLCGKHKGNQKKELAKNPDADRIRKELLSSRVAAARAQVVPGQRGRVTAAHIGGMFKEYSFEPKPGYLPIFPNNKHGHGFGYGLGDFSGLSPMKLGPVRHGQAGWPDAKNIENYHQFNKVFPQEIDPNNPCDCPRAAEWPHAKPLPEFFEARRAAYLDVVPHRHKITSKGKNVPLYSVHDDKHYTYVESRYFYCHQMQLLAKATPQFAALRKMVIQDGLNLQIVGYDAYEPSGVDPESLYAHYCDGSRPFGHEMVILTMLVIDDEKLYPWERERCGV